MNKFSKLIVLGLAVLAPLAAVAQGKIAVLDIQGAIMQTEMAKKEIKALQSRADFADSLKQLDGLQNTYKTNVEKFKKNQAVMSDEQRQAEAKKLQNSASDMQHVQKKLQTAERELMKALVQAHLEKLKVVMSEVIKEESIGMLLDRKSALHVDGGYDITSKVTAKLNLAK